ncbi:hypothetical protein R1sor_020032 [Riccia sorocarpa]|uniref:DUF7866 domain-containing protein n=1 Tax=Riccia sorocarpa TaxID=122646 RepID=A0ABD3IHV7_9MARC
MLACFLLACQQAFGTEFRESREVERIDGNSSPVDGKNLYRREDGTLVELFPEPEAHLQIANSTRRKLGEFLGCAVCTCCDAEKTYCKHLPCCYSINCNVQPFGLCKFVPVVCNCNGCGL